jgi:hypothetical protein
MKINRANLDDLLRNNFQIPVKGISFARGLHKKRPLDFAKFADEESTQQ